MGSSGVDSSRQTSRPLEGQSVTTPSAQRLPRNFFNDAAPFKVDGVYCKLIPLTQGLFSLVWEVDYRWLQAYRWHAAKDYRTGKFYAQRYGGKKRGEPQRNMAMHRQILGLSWDDQGSGDHREPLKTLDNRRSNLRDAAPSQQQHNKGKQKNNTTGFKNVVYEPSRKAYRATLQTNGKRKNLGRRKTAEEAFALVCAATLEQHGEFARTA